MHRVIFLPRGMQAPGKGHLRLSVLSPNPRPLCAHTFVEIRTLGTCAGSERQKARTVLARGGAPGFRSDGHRCREAQACGQQLPLVWKGRRLSPRREVSSAPRRRGPRSADVSWGGPGGLAHDAGVAVMVAELPQPTRVAAGQPRARGTSLTRTGVGFV